MKILAYPKCTANPYQELLYSEMRLLGATVTYIKEPKKNSFSHIFSFIPKVLFFRLRGYSFFHLHWTYDFMLRRSPWQTPFWRTVFYIHYIACLYALKLFKFKVIWTAHDTVPHEDEFNNDQSARKWLIRVLDGVIVHNQNTLKELTSFGTPLTKTAVIPHGHYKGYYFTSLTKEQAKKNLGVHGGAFVYLFFGNIRDYKGVDLLIEAYKKIDNPNKHLIVAGKLALNQEKTALLLHEASQTHNISFFGGRISDEDTQLFLQAADIVVLPFKKVTTSGSTLLAFSFKKTVIIPNEGDLVSLSDDICFKYDSRKPDGLLTAMNRAYKEKDLLKKKEVLASLYIEKFSWDRVAQDTYAFLRTL